MYWSSFYPDFQSSWRKFTMLKSTLTNPFCLEGESFFRIFEGGLHSTTPFLGVNRWGVAGIGLKFYDEKRSPIFFGGYSFSYKLITLWRALRLLELTRIIENNGSTFAACIGLFQPNKFCAGGDEADIRELADQFGGKSELQKIHAVILESFPIISSPGCMSVGCASTFLSSCVSSGGTSASVDWCLICQSSRKFEMQIHTFLNPHQKVCAHGGEHSGTASPSEIETSQPRTPPESGRRFFYILRQY